jgi:hypothetical protein
MTTPTNSHKRWTDKRGHVNVGEVEEHRVAVGVQRSIGVEGSDRFVNGSSRGDGDDGHRYRLR